jgi:thiol-disulfide isomerase/thioredoxin
MRAKLLFAFIVCFYYSQAQMSDTTILIGQIDRTSLTSYNWYTMEYAKYSPDQRVLDKLKPYVANLRVMVIMGTWCSDSHEWIPPFYKIAKKIGLPENQIELIAVDRKKHCPSPDITSLNIEYVPTFFVFYKGKLMGKIVETPETTFEGDLLNLIEQNEH